MMQFELLRYAIALNGKALSLIYTDSGLYMVLVDGIRVYASPIEEFAVSEFTELLIDNSDNAE